MINQSIRERNRRFFVAFWSLFSISIFWGQSRTNVPFCRVPGGPSLRGLLEVIGVLTIASLFNRRLRLTLRSLQIKLQLWSLLIGHWLRIFGRWLERSLWGRQVVTNIVQWPYWPNLRPKEIVFMNLLFFAAQFLSASKRKQPKLALLIRVFSFIFSSDS